MNNKPTAKWWHKIISPEVLDVIRLIHFCSPWGLPVILGRNIVEALKPFINIVCSSMILEGLYAGEPVGQIMRVVIWMAALNLLATLLISLLDWLANGYLHVWFAYDQQFAAKTLTLDYERMEQTEVQNMLRLHDEVDNIGGVVDFSESLGRTVKWLVSVVYAIVLIVPFFFTRTVTGSGVLPLVFTSPLSALLLAAVLVGSIWGALHNFKQKEKMMQEDWEKSLAFNRTFRYFHNTLLKYQIGKELRSYRLGDFFVNRFSQFGDLVTDYQRRTGKLEERYGGRIILISQLAVTLFYILVGAKALLGVITVGSILRYVGALSSFHEGFLSLLTEFTNMNIYAAHLKTDVQFFRLHNQKYEGQLPVEKRDDNEYELEFRDVSFRYPGSGHNVLDHLSFKLKVGEKLALVGQNGAGKTTFIKLLCRLYDPTEGEILLNGIDIKKYDYQEYQSLFSVVFQDFKLFSFEVGQNVAANTDYDERRVWDSLDRAGVGDRVRRMKRGLQTVLYQSGDDGVEVSGGEAQKIAIARALYKDAPIIILDEPTSALDPISEYEIYSRFDNLVSAHGVNKTAIYISHRMSSCRFCDKIAVFAGGGVREVGSHDELMALQGRYYRMWQAQAQYYQEDQKMHDYLRERQQA